jgi:hypothetical protein
VHTCGASTRLCKKGVGPRSIRRPAAWLLRALEGSTTRTLPSPSSVGCVCAPHSAPAVGAATCLLPSPTPRRPPPPLPPGLPPAPCRWLPWLRPPRPAPGSPGGFLTAKKKDVGVGHGRGEKRDRTAVGVVALSVRPQQRALAVAAARLVRASTDRQPLRADAPCLPAWGTAPTCRLRRIHLQDAVVAAEIT